ncbi:MAG: hypothetical protein ACK4K9_11265 [Bacteroidia bacterium]
MEQPREYKEFFIDKNSNTYAETLEAYGLANLIDEILSRSNASNRKVEIFDKGLYYLIKPSQSITEEMLSNLSYFQIIKFLKSKIDTKVPDDIGNNFYDYPNQKKEFDEIKDKRNKISTDKKMKPDEKKEQLRALQNQFESEFGKKLDEAFDVYKNMVGNPYTGYTKAHSILHNNQEYFSRLLNEILTFYSTIPNVVQKINREFKIDEKLTAQQLYSPNQGKGLNQYKANNANMTNLDSYWVQELMKISGALHMMICQYVKVGSSYDLKIFVPEYKHILWSKAKELMLEFKRHLKSVSPVKLDILNILNFSVNFIQRSEEFTGKLKNTINGFHSVYQKDLGQNKAVANIAFLEVPEFIEINDRKSANEWIEILNAQKNIINAIKEQGDAIQGLLAYRNFLSGGNLQSFFKFCNWYSVYLMQALDKEQYYVKPFKIETLNLFYMNMDNETLNLSEIIANEGFKAVAQAIRKSTVSLQYTPKDARKFEIRYGLAQELQNKSKSKLDLATFIGGVIATYNAETAKVAEKNGGKSFRANVKDEELAQFYALLDKHPSRLIGALLASYGFALKAKEVKDEGTEDLTEENE